MALIPAYGRDYKSAKDVFEAYQSGKDFIQADVHSRWNGMYCSCRDFEGEEVELRYHKKTKVTFAIYP
jgi:hypothetical protein